MADYDVIIIGGGPAGLTAGIELCKAKYRTIVLEKESFGGHLLNVEKIDDMPGIKEGMSGGQLASQMVEQASKCGLQLEQAEVTGIEMYSSSRWVSCEQGKGFTSTVVIIAGGYGPKKLGIPGESALWGKGVFTCAHCEGGLYAGKVVAVCGTSDAAVNDAVFLAERSAKVILLESGTALTATAGIVEKAKSNPRIEMVTGTAVASIFGDGAVSGIETIDNATGKREKRMLSGVCVSIGTVPNTDYLDGIVELDQHAHVTVNSDLETDVPFILAAGEIRSGSARIINEIMSDGIKAAKTVQRLLTGNK